MATLKQSQIDKMKKVSFSELEQTTNHLRNYIVYIGEKFATHFIQVHCGFDIEKNRNHLQIIKELVKNQPIHHVLLDNVRKFGSTKKMF